MAKKIVVNSPDQIGDNFEITLLNYFKVVDAEILACLPDYLRQKHVYLKVITDNGTDWETLETHPVAYDKVETDQTYPIGYWQQE